MNKKLGGGILAVIVVIGIKIAIGLGVGSGIGFFSAKAGAPDVGECLEINPDDPKVMDKQVPCTTKPSPSTVVAKVTKIDATTASLKCGKREFPLPNKTRHTSMCIGNPAA